MAFFYSKRKLLVLESSSLYTLSYLSFALHTDLRQDFTFLFILTFWNDHSFIGCWETNTKDLHTVITSYTFVL